VPSRAGRAHRRDHLIADLTQPAVADHTSRLRRLHVAARGLAVNAGLGSHHAQPSTAQPATQHFPNLDHMYLPERHRSDPHV